MERRRTIRLLTDKGLVSIGRRSKDIPGAGWPLRDISEGGLRFTVPEGLPGLPKSGENVVVTVEIGASAKGVRKGDNQLSATVRRVKKAGRGEREVSLEFTGLSPADRERIRGTVLDLAMEKVQGGARVLARPPRVHKGKGEARLGDILVAHCTLSREEMERFVQDDLEETGPLGRQLVAKGLVDEKAVAKALAEQSGLDHIDLDAEGVDLLKVRRFGADYLTRHLFVPVSMDSSRITLAAAAPLAKETIDAVSKLCNRRVNVAIASERQIVSVIQKAFHVARNRRGSVRFPAGLSVRFKLYDEDWGRLHD
ncbi:MAG: GspE/PulE/PilB domain-containing protein, partial [Planctomycetota bacterium]